VIYEYRVYEAVPGRLADVQARFRDHTVKLFEKHGMKNIGYWTADIGDYSDRLFYIVAFDSLEQRQRAWASFRSDPEWQRVVAESEANGPIVARVTNTLLTPTDYSPLQ
jgi:hypothetical protein